MEGNNSSSDNNNINNNGENGNGSGEVVDLFSLLPEGCIANTISLTPPRDACRLSPVASNVRSATTPSGRGSCLPITMITPSKTARFRLKEEVVSLSL